MKYGIKRVLRGYQGLSNVSIEVKFVYASNSFRNRKPRFKSLLFLKKISAVISAVETAIVSLILPS